MKRNVKKSRRRRLLDRSDLRTLIMHLIVDKKWSSEQVSGRLKREKHIHISYATIYREIKQHNMGWSKPPQKLRFAQHLRHRGKARHDRGYVERRGHKDALYIPIAKRPNYINQRTRIGDWEIDTVLGKTGHHALVTMVDRYSRFAMMRRIEFKNAQATNAAIIDLARQIDPLFMQSLTPDHGSEFTRLNDIQDDLGVLIYQPDPYAPHQRGSNENLNGLLREYFPKNSNLDNISDSTIDDWQLKLNQRPKKIFNYLTPDEIFNDKVLPLDLTIHPSNKPFHLSKLQLV